MSIKVYAARTFKGACRIGSLTLLSAVSVSLHREPLTQRHHNQKLNFRASCKTRGSFHDAACGKNDGEGAEVTRPNDEEFMLAFGTTGFQ